VTDGNKALRETRPLKNWTAAIVAIALVLTVAKPTTAESPPTPSPSRTLPDLMALFPSPEQLPAGMVLTEEGTRTAAEIAATFPDPTDAAQVLETWGWSLNAYRVYVADPNAGADPRTFLTCLEISLHQFQFSTNSMAGCATCGASYALSYFAHGRAVALDQIEILAPGMRPCEAMVTGEGEQSVQTTQETTETTETTVYLRYGNLLIRVTATMPRSTYHITLAEAVATAGAVMGNAGGSLHELDQTCQ
jgi:hypothetical protein